MSLWRCRWWTTGGKRTGFFFFFFLCFPFLRQKAVRMRERERRVSEASTARSELRKRKKKKSNGNSLCVSPHVDVCRVFVDARELGKSRVRTNHSVAGIHYYRREYVPKSTLRSPPFLSSSLPFTSESSGTFFFFFFFSNMGALEPFLFALSLPEQSREKW